MDYRIWVIFTCQNIHIYTAPEGVPVDIDGMEILRKELSNRLGQTVIDLHHKLKQFERFEFILQ